MCEYCGCQDVAAIAVLTREHGVVVNLGGEARRALAAGDLELAADRARAISAVLAPHTAVEERALFPAMSAEFPGHVADLMGEHRVIEGVLAESVDGTPTDPGWPARLDRALTLLREHILKEEDGLFPAALAGLSPADWDRLGAVRRQVRSAVAAASG
jgi:hemerythrin-like domain-containing protein